MIGTSPPSKSTLWKPRKGKVYTEKLITYDSLSTDERSRQLKQRTSPWTLEGFRKQTAKHRIMQFVWSWCASTDRCWSHLFLLFFCRWNEQEWSTFRLAAAYYFQRNLIRIRLDLMWKNYVSSVELRNVFFMHGAHMTVSHCLVRICGRI